MLKKTITYVDYKDGKEHNVTEQLRFRYTLPAIRQYELTTGGNFFDDLDKTLAVVTEKTGGKIFNPDDEADFAVFLPLLANKTVNEFVKNVALCFYAEDEGGALVQNEQTYANACESLWVTQLINVEFFFNLLEEFNIGGSKGSKGAGRKKK